MDNSKKISKQLFPYLLIAPAFTILVVFVVYPIINMIYLSFFDWNLMSEKTFVGIANFVEIFKDDEFHQVFWNSCFYVVATVVLSMGIALILAVYLNKNSVINKIMQSVIFVPHIICLVSVSFIWMWLMDKDYGLLNYILGIFGVDPIGWLDDPKYALLSLVIIAVWKSVGYNAIILLSAMQTIPPYLYEAAALDKTSATTRFFKITLPMISPSIFFLTLMSMISAFKVFEPVNLITKGGPLNSTNTFVNMIYEYGFKYYRIGYASAVGVVLMVLIGICTFFYFKGLDKKVHYR